MWRYGISALVIGLVVIGVALQLFRGQVPRGAVENYNPWFGSFAFQLQFLKNLEIPSFK